MLVINLTVNIPLFSYKACSSILLQRVQSNSHFCSFCFNTGKRLTQWWKIALNKHSGISIAAFMRRWSSFPNFTFILIYHHFLCITTLRLSFSDLTWHSEDKFKSIFFHIMLMDFYSDLVIVTCRVFWIIILRMLRDQKLKEILSKWSPSSSILLMFSWRKQPGSCTFKIVLSFWVS